MSNKLTQKDGTISFNFSPKDIALLLVYFVLGAALIWQSIRPFLAERHFRDGYYLTRKRFARFAVNHLQKSVDYAPWEAHYTLQLGKAYETMAKQQSSSQKKAIILRRAIPLYQHIMRLDPKNPWYKTRLAFIYLSLSDIETNQREAHLDVAEKVSKDAAEADRQNPIFLLAYAQLLHKRGKSQAALPLYKRIIEIDRRILEASYNLGDIYLRQKDFDNAFLAYKTIYEINPNFGNTRIALAQIYLIKNQPKPVILLLEEELRARPKPPLHALNILGRAYQKEGHWDKAIQTYERFLARRPDDFALIQLTSLAYHHIGKKRKAQKLVRAYLRRHPNNKDAATLLKKLQ